MAGINTNIASLNAQRNLLSSQADLNKSIQRLSSGLRVNSAKDDAAGLAIATRLDAQSRGMTAATRNVNDGISLLQISDGALSTVSGQLQRMRELAVQAKNGTNSTDDTKNLKAEFDALSTEITKVVSGAKFNDTTILSGTTDITIQVGAGKDDTRDLKALDLAKDAVVAGTGGVQIAATVDISTNAGAAIDAVDGALTALNTARAKLGSHLSAFDSILSDLSVRVENTEAAKSRIMDTDFAAETAKMTRNQILQQAGTAMLAQANQLPNTVMTLLRG